MRRIVVAFSVLLLAIVVMPGIAAGSNATAVTVSSTKAPVVPDGLTAGAVPDFVLTFVDADPAGAGLHLRAGATLQATLPADFAYTGAGGDIGIVLQGWPQSPIVPFPWVTTVDGHTITVTMTEEWAPGTVGPGPKQIHLMLFSFLNPAAGTYPVFLEIRPDPASPHTVRGRAAVEIIADIAPSINVVSVFSGPPGPPPPFFNPLFQTVALGGSARQVGMYLWDHGGSPLLDVDYASVGRGGGVLHRAGSVVGNVRIDGPRGARHHELTSTGPSVEVAAAVTSVPTGLLVFQFEPDPYVVGEYRLSFSLTHGNSQEIVVTVVP